MPEANKVELVNGEVLIDLTNDTVASDKMQRGTTAHSASGETIEGILEKVQYMTQEEFDAAEAAGTLDPDGYYSTPDDKQTTTATDEKVGVMKLYDTMGDSVNGAVTQKAISEALAQKGTYSKPSGGIPATDLSSAVQASLGKAVTTDTEVTDIRVGADRKTYETAGDAVRGQIGQLSESMNEIDKAYKEYNDSVWNLMETGSIAVFPIYKNGRIDSSTGGIIGKGYEQRLYTSFVYVPKNAIVNITCSPNYLIQACWWYKMNGDFVAYTSDTNKPFNVIDSALLRITIYKSNGNITPEDGIENVTITLSHNSIYDLFPNMNVGENTYTLKYKGSPSMTEGGFIDTDGSYYASEGYKYSVKIPVKMGDVVYGIGTRTDSFAEELNMRKVCVYSGNTIMQNFGGDNSKHFTVPNNTGITDIVISIAQSYSDYYIIVATKKDLSDIDIAKTKLEGKTVYGFGDSLMYGHYSKIGMLDILCDRTNMFFSKYGLNGAKITGQWEILKQIMLASSIEPDYIVFNGGTNDALQSVAIGEFSTDYTEKGYDTFANSFDNVCSQLRGKYPNTKIIYVSPHKMPTSSYSVQKSIHDMALNICDKYSISVVDIYKHGQINTRIDSMRNDWSYDTAGTTSGGNGTHLTGEGYYKFYAPLIKAKMLELLND